MLMLAMLLLVSSIRTLCFGQNFNDYYQSDDTDAESLGAPEQGSGFSSVSSLDDLLELLHPEYSTLQQCRRRRRSRMSTSSSSSSNLPTLHRRPEEDLWGHPRQKALHKASAQPFYNEVMRVLIEELHRTVCRPREVCLEVAKELPESTNRQYKPRCVAVHRCGGCCNHEGVYCTNTSHTLVNKTLLEMSPRTEYTVVMAMFVNHTSCQCLSKQPRHSIIRRATNQNLCPLQQVPCSPGLLWDVVSCQCLPVDSSSYSDREFGSLDPTILALCGPTRILDQSSCECVCRNGLTEASCEPGWRLDHDTCECQCEIQEEGWSCPAGQRWDMDLCGCICEADCPRNQPLNPDTCLCQCRESHQSCLRQGRKFNPSTCSCYRPPCRPPRGGCRPGLYLNRLVCACIPPYMRPDWN